MLLAARLPLRGFRVAALHWKPRPLGLGPLLGLTLALVTLVVGLGWRVMTDELQTRAASVALDQRLGRGVVGTSAVLKDERLQTLLTAEAVSATDGLPAAVAAGNTQRTLQLLENRHKAVSSELLAVIARSGTLLAADPATNLPLAATGPVRQAMKGQSSVAAIDDPAGVALLAVAPVRQGGQTIGAVLALQPLDDRLMNSAQDVGDLSSALLLQGHVVAASRLIRSRYAENHSQPVTLIPATGLGQPAHLAIGPASFAVASQALLSLGPGRSVTLVVGEPVAAGGSSPTSARFWLTWGSPLLAAVLVGVLGWLIGRRLGGDILRLRDARDPGPRVAGAEIALLASSLARERASAAARHADVHGEIDRLRAVFDAVQDGIIVSGADRRVLLANAAAQRLLGLTGGTADAVLALLPPPEGGTEVHAGARSLRSYSAPIGGVGGALGVVTVLHDATEERESERLKSEFLSVASHEFQTPLAAIVGAADLLLEGDPGALTGEQTRFLTAIRRNSHRLISLVSDLLDVSRLEAGRVELDCQPVDLGVLARSGVRAVANLFEQKSQTVVVRAPEGLPPALGDRRRIEQVLANLLANAGQHTPAGGQIEVEVAAAGAVGGSGRVVLSVADDGPGISATDQARIFDKFYRGSNAAARRERGSGLGLSIVRSLAELHGGSVWVESAPGQGSRFSVALPVATDQDE
ncbi:MAG TPA: ATP-binding protein [Chloroflexota bacterium]|nr:ATP-binding protein [Chloroflexota bacterium]